MVKNQYFGDRHDFFKYDLALTLIEHLDFLDKFTFIPMLTPDDGSTDGRLTNYEAGRRRGLERFLKSCIQEGDRDIVNLRAYMRCRPRVQYAPYRDQAYFVHEHRDQYFEGVGDLLLTRAVVVVDPDNGFEVKSTRPANAHKYFLYSELERLYRRMCPESLLVAYQYIPRVQREPYFARIGRRIREQVDVSGPLCVSDNKVAFFVLARADEVLKEAWVVLRDYAGEAGCMAYWCDNL